MGGMKLLNSHVFSCERMFRFVGNSIAYNKQKHKLTSLFGELKRLKLIDLLEIPNNCLVIWPFSLSNLNKYRYHFQFSVMFYNFSFYFSFYIAVFTGSRANVSR